jgi:hypothetical protein
MTASEHIEDLAELYALGTLGARQRELVDAHVRTCDACAARLGEAETTVAQLMDEVEPPATLDRRVRSAFAPGAPGRWMPVLVAAAFIVGLLPALGMWSGIFGSRGFDTDRELAVRAMVTSHFVHTPFTALASDAPKAKLIYGRSSNWRFIIAQTPRALDVAVQENGTTRVLGRLHVRGDAAELFISNAPQSRAYVLLDGTRPVARATLPRRP